MPENHPLDLFMTVSGEYLRIGVQEHRKFHFSVLLVQLSFLQDLIDNMKAFSTVEVYLVVISACHVRFVGKPVGQHPLFCQFMKGTSDRYPSPSLWDLAVVLEALTSHPYLLRWLCCWL